jgi:hypothetical protein
MPSPQTPLAGDKSPGLLGFITLESRRAWDVLCL